MIYVKFPNTTKVKILDGRNRLSTMAREARKLAKEENAKSFQIIRSPDMRDMGDILYEEEVK
jgi:hypothetical protein